MTSSPYFDPDEAAQVAYDNYQASRADPGACEICGDWLGDAKRAPVGRAHFDCYQEVMFEMQDGYDVDWDNVATGYVEDF